MRMLRTEEDLLREFIETSLQPIPQSRFRRLPSKGFDGLLLPESYVQGVLGINRSKMLLEGVGIETISEIVLREHLIFEGWFDSVKDKVKGWLKDNPVTNAVDAVKELGDKGKATIVALTSIVNSGGDAIGTVVSGAKNLLSKNVTSISKSIETITKAVKNLAGRMTNAKAKAFVEKMASGMANFKSKLVSKIQDAIGAGGWKGMFSILAVYLGTDAVRSKIETLSTKIAGAIGGDKKKMKSLGASLLANIASEQLEDDDDDEEEQPPEIEGEDGEAVEGVSQLKKAAFKLVLGFLKKIITVAGGEAVEQLAGPVGYIKKLGEIFSKIAGGTAWVCEKILGAISRAQFKPLGSPSGGAT